MQPGPPSRLPLTAGGKLFFAAMIVLGLSMVPLGLWAHPLNSAILLPLAYLAIYTQIAALLPIRWSRGLQHIFTPPLLAAGLFAPGGGVALVTWLALYDGRRPGPGRPIWLLTALRGAIAITHGAASLLVALIPVAPPWDLPVKTVLYSVLIVLINYPLTATGFALIHRTRVISELTENIGLSTIRSVLVLGFAGGLLFQILQLPVGYIMALGLIALLLAVRANIADAQKQARLRVQTLELAAAALDARDSYTESHSARVAELAERIATVMKLSFREIETIRTAALLHDVGKIGVPDAILNKPGPLDDYERSVMNEHPVIGAELIQRHDALAHVSPLVRSHHERWDGGGYPDGTVGSLIPIGARIIAVADAYDTLTGVRVYKPTKASPQAAVDDLRSRTGTWYDPAVIAAAIAVLTPQASPPVTDHTGKRSHGQRSNGLNGAVLIASHAISAIGDPLTTVAIVVTTVQATHSAAAVGLIYVLKAATTFALTVFLGDVGDRLPRRLVVIAADAIRAAALIALLSGVQQLGIYVVIPFVIVHAAATAVGSPTRQASAADIFEERLLPRAIGTLTSVASAANIAGFAIAGVLVLVGVGIPRLLLADSATFVAAGALFLMLPGLSRGTKGLSWKPAAVTLLREPSLRLHLFLTAVAGTAAGMSFPALVFVAAEAVGRAGVAAAYSWLEVALAAGVTVGSIAATKIATSRTWTSAKVGLLIMGLASLVVSADWHLATAVIAIFVASAGSAVYVVANQAGVLASTEARNRASVMTLRFTAGYIASVVGTGIGAMTTAWFSGHLTYAVIGGLLIAGVVLVRGSIVRAGSTVIGAADRLPVNR